MKLNLQFSFSGASSLALALATLFGGIVSTATAAGFDGRAGLQLYSLRNQFAKDVPGTLDEVKGFGVKYVELAGTYKLAPEKFRAELDARGLKAISGHFDYGRFRDDPEGVAREAKALGMKYAGCAWIPHDSGFDEKLCRDAIGVFNHAGEVLAKHGIKFFYHVHGYEFQPHGDGTLLDLLITETNPKYVNYQMDIFWIVFPGQDPVKLLEKYNKRWVLMHLKDMKSGVKTGSLSGGTDPNNDAALGEGQMDLPRILLAAKKLGVKYYFIEDESSSSEAQIPRSLHYLKTVKW
jgi:sugar phosphate isomerase/epimerase